MTKTDFDYFDEKIELIFGEMKRSNICVQELTKAFAVHVNDNKHVIDNLEEKEDALDKRIEKIENAPLEAKKEKANKTNLVTGVIVAAGTIISITTSVIIAILGAL